MRIVIQGGWVIDPSQNINEKKDVLIEEKRIVKIAKNLGTVKSDFQIDAKGKIVVPGFVDMHVHLREPGLENKETIDTGTRGALKGGVTTAVCMPNTKPVIDSTNALEKLLRIIEKKAHIRVYPTGAISKGLMGTEPAEMEAMLKAGAIALTDDGRTTLDTEIMRKAFQVAKKNRALVMTHSEDHEVTEKDKTRPSPCHAEADIVKRDIALAREESAPLHVCHVSAEDALAAIETAQKRGENITCEAEPHHLVLSDLFCKPNQAFYKVNPPIRSEADRRAIIKGLQSGSVGMVATDHAPHEQFTKLGDYEHASFGFSGIETAFALCYTHLVKKGHIPLETLIKAMTVTPALRLNLPFGTLKSGSEADIAVIDLEKRWKIKSEKFETKGKNTPFEGWEVWGEVVHVLVGGDWKLRKGEVCV